MKNVEDWFLDTALEEVLGRAKPPDLTERIHRLDQGSRVRHKGVPVSGCGRLLRLPSPHRDTGRRKVLGSGAVWAALSLLLIWSGSRLLNYPPPPPQTEGIATLEVLQGDIEWQGGDSTIQAGAGEVLQLHMSVGNRLYCGNDAAALRIEPFAVLYTRPKTTMEILDMQTLRKNGAVIVGGLTLAVVAGAVTVDRLVRVEQVEAGQVLRLEGPLNEVLSISPESESDKGAFGRALEELKSQPINRAVSPSSPGDARARNETVHLQVRFATDTYREALAAVDWELVGATVEELARVTGEIAEHALEGETVPLKALAKQKQLSGLMLELGLPLRDGGIPGEGDNGVFSHPLVLANSIDFTLAAAGTPLEQRQLNWLQGIVQHYAAEDENIRITAESQELASEAFLAEMNMKSNLYREIREVLTSEQQQLLLPEAARGRSQIELFGVGGDWGTFAKSIITRGPEEYANRMTVTFQTALGLSNQQTILVRSLMERYAHSYPRSYWDQKSSLLDKQGFIETTRIRVVAERQIGLLRDILDNVELTPEQRETVRNTKQVLVPLPR